MNDAIAGKERGDAASDVVGDRGCSWWICQRTDSVPNYVFVALFLYYVGNVSIYLTFGASDGLYESVIVVGLVLNGLTIRYTWARMQNTEPDVEASDSKIASVGTDPVVPLDPLRRFRSIRTLIVFSILNAIYASMLTITTHRDMPALPIVGLLLLTWIPTFGAYMIFRKSESAST